MACDYFVYIFNRKLSSPTPLRK